MKLLLITERFSIVGAGAENDAVRLCTALAGRGHDVHVAADEGDSIGAVRVHRTLADLDRIREDLAPDVTIDWGFHAVADIHRVGGAVHLEFLRHAAMSAPVWARWLKRLGHLKRKHRAQIRKETLILARSRGLFLPISHFVAAQIRRHGVAESRINVLHNSVDVKRFNPQLRADVGPAMRREWGVPDGAIVLLFVANDLRLKNFAMLQRLMSRLNGDAPELRLVVVGKRRPRVTAPWLIHQPTLTTVEAAYAAADLLLHPSYFDSFGNVVLEAMSCAVPVVVSETSGVSELVRAGGGKILSVTDADSLATWETAVRGLLQEPDRRAEMGAAGRRVAERHRFSDHVEAFDGVLARQLAARPLGDEGGEI